MALDPSAEYERVRERYAAVRPWELAAFVIAVVVMSLFRPHDWWMTVAAAGGLAGWELVKWRLRRNARWFTGSSGTG